MMSLKDYDKYRRWYEKNKELAKARAYASYVLNKEHRRDVEREYRKNNPEVSRKASRKYAAANRDKINAYGKVWRQENKEKANEKTRRYRARKRGQSDNFTASQWLALKQKYNSTCLKCLKQEPEIKLEADHVVPLSCGGSNDITNIQPLCEMCNRTKHTQTVDYRQT